MLLRPNKKFKIESYYQLCIGLFVSLFISILILKMNPNFAGAKHDSKFYFNMYEYIRNHKSLIPLELYEVSSSPIFVHFFGFSLLIFGAFYVPVIYLSFISMSLISLVFFEKFIRNTNIYIKVILLVAFCGSGYFVSPMLYPTSETPTILFFILSLYAFLKSKNRRLLAVSIFALVSVRQSMGWLLIVFFLWDLKIWWKVKSIPFRRIVATYLLAGISLIVTFIYFNFHFFPDLYINVQPENIFPLPNFLSSVQIGISLLTFTLPFLLYEWKFIGITFLAKLFLLFISGITLCSLIFTHNTYIGEGLGYLSILSLNYNVDLIFIVLLSYVGFLSVFFLSQGLNIERKQFLYLFLVCFLTSSLIIPIPYLRYFQIPIIFCLLLVLDSVVGEIERSKKWRLVLIFLGFNATNILAITF